MFTNLFERFMAQIITQCKQYKTEFDRASRHAVTSEIFSVEKQLYDQCSKQIGSAIELYASLIELYVSGINAAGTMLLIERAHLAKDIDFLQREKVSDQQKVETTASLIGDIFGAGRLAIAQIGQACELFPIELKKWSAECDALSDEAGDLHSSDFPNSRFVPDLAFLVPVWEDAIQPLVTRFEGWQEEYRAKIAMLLNKKVRWRERRIRRWQGRVICLEKRIRLVSVIVGILIALVATGYYKFDPVRWSRLSEQLFRVDKWSVCRG